MAINDDIFGDVLRVFETVYAERGVYRELAKRVPGWEEELEAAMEPSAYYRKEVAKTFSALKGKLLDRQKVQDILQDLGKGPIH